MKLYFRDKGEEEDEEKKTLIRKQDNDYLY
jgi:hypothetical protein